MASTVATENIVIVGGGYAGVRVAQALEKRFSGNDKYRVLLVDKKSYFYHVIASPRSAVEHINNVIPYTHTFKNKEKNVVLQATVVRLEKDKVYLDTPFEGSTKLSFAYAVLATGIRYPTPSMLRALTIDGAAQEQREIQDLVKEAKSILIIGGGLTGVEVAGEIRDKYSDKKIILAHSQKQLLSDEIPDWARAQMLQKVEEINVEAILDERVILPPTTSIEEKTIFKPQEPLTTSKGTQLQADLVMLMFGMHAETGWLKDTLPLASNGGFIKVRPTLQVDAPGFDNVYAAGDVVDINEPKLAGRSSGHTRVISANIMNSTKGKELSRTYKPKNLLLVNVTLGKKQGVIFTPFGSLGDWASSFAKGKKLSTKRFWGMLNLTEPSNPNNGRSRNGPSSVTITTVTLVIAAIAAYYASISHRNVFSTYQYLISLTSPSS